MAKASLTKDLSHYLLKAATMANFSTIPPGRPGKVPEKIPCQMLAMAEL